MVIQMENLRVKLRALSTIASVLLIYSSLTCKMIEMNDRDFMHKSYIGTPTQNLKNANTPCSN